MGPNQCDGCVSKKRRLGHRPVYLQREDPVKKGKFPKCRECSNKEYASDLLALRKEWEGLINPV